jgi:GT2 family glycosyltransferase/glycosyltransferase involved in cell wall biosynthesis
VTGSRIDPVHAPDEGTAAVLSRDFLIERTGDTWAQAAAPTPLYLLTVASRTPLPAIVARSTLSDPGIQLLRAAEGAVAEEAARRIEAQRSELEAALHAERAERVGLTEERERLTGELARQAGELARTQDEHQVAATNVRFLSDQLADLRARLQGAEEAAGSIRAELDATRHQLRGLEGSVVIQAFRKLSNRFYAAIGEQSILARIVHKALQLAGRLLAKPADRTTATGSATATAIAAEPEVAFPPFAEPVASLIVPVHSGADLTLACLRSISNDISSVPYEVILVDDEADEDTRLLLTRVAGAKVIRNQRNIGYLRSVNAAAAQARGRWLVLCNNDIEVRSGWLEALLRAGESAPDVGVVTPKYVYPDGRLNEAGGIIWRDGTGANYGRGDDPDRPEYNFRREVDYGSAAALLVRADLWRERGGFDERFLPMYYEDTDLCFDARERGLRVLYEPEAVVVHVEGGTAGTDLQSGHKRHQEENRPKFVDKWRTQLESKVLRPPDGDLRGFADRNRGPRVLVVDFRVPTPDRDSGSTRMRHMIESLLRLGCRVTFLPDNFAPIQPYTRELQRLGVHVVYGSVDMWSELKTIGPEVKFVILSRPHQAARWMDVVRETCPDASVIYDTVDLHWLRELRRASIDGDGDLGDLPPKAAALREIELALVRAADTTFVVTDGERAQVEADVPGATVRVIPNVHGLWDDVPPPQQRSGVLFVGGYEHPPNVDAAVRLVRNVMPLVWQQHPDVPVTIVGATRGPEVVELGSELVKIAGWVPSLEPILASSRVMVAPLNWGAGLKGKVTQALAAGLPVVTTSIGAEGLEGPDGQHLLVADDDTTIAELVSNVLDDDELWLRLSHGGQGLIAERCSLAVMDERLGELLEAGADTELARYSGPGVA